MNTGSVFGIPRSKEYFGLIIVATLYFLCILPCQLFGLFGLAFIFEWAARENAFQKWLDENELRMDFSVYQGESDIREALLQTSPIGTSEEDLIAFYEANTSLQIYTPTWKPDNIEAFCMSRKYIRFDCKYGVLFRVNAAERDHLFKRILFNNQYVIIFELESETHTLRDIHVSFQGWETGWIF